MPSASALGFLVEPLTIVLILVVTIYVKIKDGLSTFCANQPVLLINTLYCLPVMREHAYDRVSEHDDEQRNKTGRQTDPKECADDFKATVEHCRHGGPEDC